jgi:hypothetical protein
MNLGFIKNLLREWHDSLHLFDRNPESSLDKLLCDLKRAALAMALAAGLLVGGAIAQTPPDDKEPIPPRSQLTAEQDHVIKEIVLKDITTRDRIADLSTARGREGTASQNIQILYH